MNSYMTGFVALVVFALIVFGIYFFGIRGRFSLDDLVPPPDVSPTVTQIPSTPSRPQEGEIKITIQQTPTPALTKGYEGTLSAVSTDKLEYKNSIIVVLETNNPAPSTIYVTESTIIESSGGNSISRDSLRPDMKVRIEGIPLEGGIEAKRVIVL